MKISKHIRYFHVYIECTREEQRPQMEEVIDCILCIKAHYQVLETVTSSATEDCLPLHNSRVVGHPNPARKPIA